MDSSVLEFFKESHLLSFQVDFSSSTHRLTFTGENSKVKRTWYKGILDLDFDLKRCIIRDEENPILTQSFTGFQKIEKSEDETLKFMTLIFRHDEWKIIPQNIAEEKCIRYVAQYISDYQSVKVEEIVKNGMNKGIIGLGHAQVMKHGLVQQCDSNGSKVKLRFLVLIPGKLFGFQEIEGQRASLVLSLFDAKVMTLPEVGGFQLQIDISDALYFNPVQEAEWGSWAKELNAAIDLTKDAQDGVLVTQQENKTVGVQDEKKQGDSNEVQEPLRRGSQLIVTPEQARQLSMLKKPVSRARLCLADSLSELEALLRQIKTSNTLSELEMFYISNSDSKRKGNRFCSSSPTRRSSGRENLDWGYKSSRRRSRDDLCLHSFVSRKTSFGFTPKYDTANKTYSSYHSGTTTRQASPLRSSREDLYNTELQVRQEPVLAEESKSFRPSMEDTLRAQSSLFCPQDMSISACATNSSLEEHNESQKAYPSNDADSLPEDNIQYTKGGGDFAEVAEISKTSKNDSDNVLPKRKSTLKLSQSCRPNRVSFSPEPEIREFSDDFSVEITQGDQRTPDVPPVTNAGDQSKSAPSSKMYEASQQLTVDLGCYSPGNTSTEEYQEKQQSETYDNPRQLAFDRGQYSPRNNSMEELQEMQQSEMENRYLTELPPVQPFSSYKQSRVQSMNPNKLAIDATGSVEPRASMPNNELNDPDSRYMYQGSSTEEVDPIYSNRRSFFQDEPSPFEISSESSGNSSEGDDVEDLDIRLTGTGLSEHSSREGSVSQNSMPAEGRQSRYNLDNIGIQNILSPAFGEGNKLSFNVRDEVAQGRVSTSDVMDVAPESSFSGRKSGFGLQNEEPAAPVFPAEARKSSRISQDDLPSASGFAADARKSRFAVMDEEPQSTAGPITGAGQSRANQDEQPSGSKFSAGRKSRYLMGKDEDPTLDYQRNSFAPQQIRSTSLRGDSDGTAQESLKLSTIRKSRVNFGREEDALLTDQGVYRQSSTTQKSMHTSDYDEASASSDYQSSLPVTQSGKSSSSRKSFVEVQLEHPQAPRISVIRKSRVISPKDDDAAWDSPNSSQTNTTTQASQGNEPNVNETFSRDWFETRKSRSILRDEAERPQQGSTITEGRKSRFMSNDGKSPVLMVVRKSRIIMETDGEDLVAPPNYEGGFSASHSARSSSAMLAADDVQLQQPPTPTFSETENSGVNFGKDAVSGYQRKSLASMADGDMMIEPIVTEVRRSDWDPSNEVVASSYQENSTSSHPGSTGASVDPMQPNEGDVSETSWKNSASTRSSTSHPALAGFEAAESNVGEVPQSYHARKSEWRLSREPVTSSRLSMFRASMRAQKNSISERR